MRIIVDKIESGPVHAVTPAEVRETLRRLPSDWASKIKFVRISASMHSWDVAGFSRVTGRLILCTRGRQKPTIFAAMSRALFSDATLARQIPEWRLSAKQKRAMDAKVAAQLAEAARPNPELASVRLSQGERA